MQRTAGAWKGIRRCPAGLWTSICLIWLKDMAWNKKAMTRVGRGIVLASGQSPASEPKNCPHVPQKLSWGFLPWVVTTVTVPWIHNAACKGRGRRGSGTQDRDASCLLWCCFLNHWGQGFPEIMSKPDHPPETLWGPRIPSHLSPVTGIWKSP